MIMLRQLHLMHLPRPPAPACIRTWLRTAPVCSAASDVPARHLQKGTSPNGRQRHLSSCCLITAPGHLQHMPTVTLLCSIQVRDWFLARHSLARRSNGAVSPGARAGPTPTILAVPF